MTLPLEILNALENVRRTVDATQQTIEAIEDLRETIDVEKLVALRGTEERAWRELEDVWQTLT